MKIDWNDFLRVLSKYPEGVHRVLPPCPPNRLDAVQSQLGAMPETLIEMLHHFNGAKLFCSCGPLISIFGISTFPPMPPLFWAPDWYIDRFSPTWRSTHAQPTDWVIGITNYGGLIILQSDELVKEWDTSEKTFAPEILPFEDWISKILRAGDEFLNTT